MSRVDKHPGRQSWSESCIVISHKFGHIFVVLEHVRVLIKYRVSSCSSQTVNIEWDLKGQKSSYRKHECFVVLKDDEL